MTPDEPSRQARKTRAALVGAFNELVLTRRYTDIRIADIIRGADVGRSTFYEHFRNKDDLYRTSLSGILTVLASAVDDDCDIPRLIHLLEHFRENLRAARGLANGSSAARFVTALTDAIAEQLAAPRPATKLASALPRELAAAQVAEGIVGLVRAWLNRGAADSPAVVAAALHRGAAATARAVG